MTVAFSAALEVDILNWVSGTDFPSAPGSITFGLLTAIPSHDGATLHELNGNAYLRQAVTFGAPTTDTPGRVSTITNTNAVIFGPATADWATVTYGAFFDGGSGDMLAYGPLAAPRAAPNNDTISFGIGALQLRSK